MNKINKAAARKAYNEGKTVTLIPCNVRIGGVWLNGFSVQKDTLIHGEPAAFDSWVNEMEYHNCNRETGRYAAYYVAQ